MSWVLLIGGVDFTGQTTREAIRMGGKAANGDRALGGVVVDDWTGAIWDTSPRPTNAHHSVLWTEDATASPTTLARGRVTGYDTGRSASTGLVMARQVAWTLRVQDQNSELLGIDVLDEERPEETDVDRVLWLLGAYCNGDPRASTVLTDDYVALSNTVTMPAKRYQGTDVMAILSDCAATAGKMYFVTIDLELFYDKIDSSAYSAPISLSDREDEVDDVDVYRVEWESGSALTLDGDQLVHKVNLIWGPNDTVTTVSNPTIETDFDYWATTIRDSEVVTAEEAADRAAAYLAGLSKGARTYQLAVHLPADKVDLLKVGQRISIKARAAVDVADVAGYRRIAELLWTEDAPGQYIAHLNLDLPVRAMPYQSNNITPSQRPVPATPPECAVADPGGIGDPVAGADLFCVVGEGITDCGPIAGSSRCTNGSLPLGTAFSTVVPGSYYSEVQVATKYGGDSPCTFKVTVRDSSFTLPDFTLLLDSTTMVQCRHGGGYYLLAGNFDVPAGYDRVRFNLQMTGGMLILEASHSFSEYTPPADPPVNDPFCVPAGTGGTSPYYAPSDDPRFDNPDQHPTSRMSVTMTNGSGGDLTAGAVVIAVDEHTFDTTTDAAQTAARAGVLLEDVLDGADGLVGWEYEALIAPLVTGAAAPGDYLFTSATAGQADLDATRAEGAVGRVVAVDADDVPTFVEWWGVPDMGGGGAGGHTIKEDGTPLTARAGLNFGSGIAATDDAGNDETDVDLDWAEDADVSTQAFGDAATTGTSQEVARGGHKHAMPANPTVGLAGALEITIDGLGSVLTTGVKRFLRIPFGLTITGWDIVADASGSVVVDVWKDTYTNFPPTVADTIAGSEKPTLSSAQKNQDHSLSTWTTSCSADDWLGINIDSATTVKRITLSINYTRT